MWLPYASPWKDSMSKHNSLPAAAAPAAPSQFATALSAALRAFQSLAQIEDDLAQAAEWCDEALKSGGKILTCGNGASACEALHLTGELMGRYDRNRPGLSSIALLPILFCSPASGTIFVSRMCSRGRLRPFAIRTMWWWSSPPVETPPTFLPRLKPFAGAARGLADCILLVPSYDTHASRGSSVSPTRAHGCD
jgi:hypothetical protein